MVAPGREGRGISRQPRVVIIGGGLAGISAALVLAEAGLRVELLERSPHLGGRAGPVFNHRLGIELDRGQHVLLGCCTNLLDFYKRTGAAEQIEFPGSIAFALGGRVGTLRPCALPEPFHLLPSLLSMRGLGMPDKARAIRLLYSTSPDPDMPAAAWLAQTGQSKRAIGSFWEPILTGALNETLDRASARYAAMVMRQAMLSNREGFRLGVPRVSLGMLHDRSARQALESRGVQVRSGEQVICVEYAGSRVAGVRASSGAMMSADYVIASTGITSHRFVSSEAVKAAGGRQAEFSPAQSPIITLYCWYREEPDIPTALCMPGRHFHWCFNRAGAPPSLPGTATALSLVASAARGLVNLRDDEILALGLGDMRQCVSKRLPNPDGWAVVRCRNATFSPLPGCDEVRPMQKTSVPNLFLAGDWTDTGWPGTMEGAVRSGYICAREILAVEGRACSVPVPDLPPQGLTRM